jgi:hypothetical protein
MQITLFYLALMAQLQKQQDTSKYLVLEFLGKLQYLVMVQTSLQPLLEQVIKVIRVSKALQVLKVLQVLLVLKALLALRVLLVLKVL